MKRILLYIAIFALVILIPVDGTDVARLRPVETVMLYAQDGEVVIRTDTKDFGTGSNSVSAFENLIATTPGIVYLDTADYLLVSDTVLDEIEPLRKCLKKDVKLFRFAGDVDPLSASEFLSVHGDGVRLKRWKKGQQLPLLTAAEKRLILS